MRFSHLSVKKAHQCLLCFQHSKTLICGYCEDDLALFSWQKYDYNLLNWPKAQRGLKHLTANKVLALADYQWPLSRLLTGLKFSNKIVHASALAKLFVHHALSGDSALPQAIIPVPLHPARYQERKYNQSVELGKCISALTGIPLATDIVTRQKATQTQTSLSSVQRKANMKNAFALHRPLNYQHVAILDDVITTGATVEALYQLMKKHHPDLQVEVWSMCLTLEH
ncbi:MAG: ComF family protein [Paraglaciecola chathamensis]|jgi:ComF family protein